VLDQQAQPGSAHRRTFLAGHSAQGAVVKTRITLEIARIRGCQARVDPPLGGRHACGIEVLRRDHFRPVEVGKRSDRGDELFDSHRMARNEMKSLSLRLSEPAGKLCDRAGNMIDRHEVERRAMAERQRPDVPFGDCLEDGIGRLEVPDHPSSAVTDDDARAGNDKRHTACRDQPLRRDLAGFIGIGEASIRQGIGLEDRPFTLPADIGSADMDKSQVAGARKLDGMGGPADIGRTVLRRGQVEASEGGAVDQQVVLPCEP